MNENGIILLLHSSNQIGYNIARDWRRSGWATRSISEVVIGDERLTVIACWRPFEGAASSRLESCDSTNDEILGLGMVEQGTFVSTDRQTGGRGHSGRKWANSEGGFMGSWALCSNSIERGPQFLQMAANVALLDTFSALLNSGLPSHSWVHGSSLEDVGLRVKWPNDIWFRNGSVIGKLCGVLVEGRTQGDDVQIVLGIGINKKPSPALDYSMGWESLFHLEFEDIFPVTVGEIALSYDTGDTIEEFDVEFAVNNISLVAPTATSSDNQ